MPSLVNANSAWNEAGNSDEALPQELVDAMQALFGKHAGYRTSMYPIFFDSSAELTFLCSI